MSGQCPKCGSQNHFVRDKMRKEVKMLCLDCGHKWLTESKICPKCERPNGFAVDGLCSQCYSDKHSQF